MTTTDTRAPRVRPFVPALRALWIALALSACGGGGGVDSGGTGSPTFASGTITGFGSVVVNGVHFDDGPASVTDEDGAARTRDDLRLGMTADIRGSAVTTDASGTPVSTASSIVFGSDIVGEVTTVDAAGNRLVVLGQTIDVVSTTVFDDASLGGGLMAIALGDVLEVYAQFDAGTGHYTATRIERKSAVASFVLRGVVSQLDAAAKSFSIGTTRISYATFGGALPGTLANGGIVRVRLRTTPVAGVWIVSALNDGVQRPQDRDSVRVEGLVTAFVSATQFSIGGVPVDASAVNLAGISLGTRLRIDGTARNGVLVATTVELRSPGGGGGGGGGSDFQVRGAIVSANAAASSFVVRGVTVVYAVATTEFKDGSAAGLVTGANVEARGNLSPDGTQLRATRIVFR